MIVGKIAKKTEKKEKIASLVKAFGKSETNTGSTESQIALITNRINTLAPHFQMHKKDNHSRRGLLKLVGQRRRLLNYLKSRDEKGYNEILVKLELRK
jgi:small subunit ribosomal protein S15